MKHLKVLIPVLLLNLFQIDIKGQTSTTFEQELYLFYALGGDADSTFWDSFDLKNSDTLSIYFSSGGCSSSPFEYKIDIVKYTDIYKESILSKKGYNEEIWGIVRKKELTKRDRLYFRFIFNKLDDAVKRGWLCTLSDDYIFRIKGRNIITLKDETCNQNAFYKIQKYIFDVAD